MTLQEFLQDLLYIVFTAVIPLLVAFIKPYIDEMIEAGRQDNNTRLVAEAVAIVESIVLSINQTYTDALKSKGKFNSETGAIAKNRALTTAKELISEESKKAIESAYNNFDSWLDTTIEAIVSENRSEAVIK